jgi:hypothetical protein
MEMRCGSRRCQGEDEMKYQFTKIAGIPALITLITIMGSMPSASSAQIWVSDIDGAVGRAISRYQMEHPRKHTVRSFYRAAHTVPLGDIVEATGSNTRSAWQARLSRDAASIGIPMPVDPRDRDGDGVEDAFDKWPNDPSRW